MAEDVLVDTPMLLCNGAEGGLVPPSGLRAGGSRQTTQSARRHSQSTFFLQENTSCTKEMVAWMATWLIDMFEAR